MIYITDKEKLDIAIDLLGRAQNVSIHPDKQWQIDYEEFLKIYTNDETCTGNNERQMKKNMEENYEVE